MVANIMKFIGLSAVMGILAACAPPPPATLGQWYFSYRAEFPELQSAMAATDLRNWDGSPREDRSLLLSSQPTGFGVWATSRKTAEEAERAAISGCNERYGRNACYIHYSNAEYVRFARRETWLQSNSSARRAIAAEQNRAAENLRQNLARAAAAPAPAQVMVAPVQTGPTAKDLAEAEALLGIAQRALESTLPRQRQTCTTMWNGIAWVTRC
jgi:hypothetical protein